MLKPQLRLPDFTPPPCPTHHISILGPNFNEWHLHLSPGPEPGVFLSFTHLSFNNSSSCISEIPLLFTTPFSALNHKFSHLTLDDSNSLLICSLASDHSSPPADCHTAAWLIFLKCNLVQSLPYLSPLVLLINVRKQLP